MSTILDALRKLQGDRDGMTTPARDLRTSVLEGTRPPIRTRQKQPTIRPWIAALGGAGVVVAGLSLYVFMSAEVDPFERAASSEALPVDSTELAQVDPAPAPEPRPLVPLGGFAAPPQPPPQPPPDSNASLEARYVPPVFERSAPDPVDTAHAGEPWLGTTETFPDRFERARERGGEPEGPGPAVNPYEQPTYAPPQIVSRSEVQAQEQRQKPPEAVELETAMDRARQRLAQQQAAPTARRPKREPREDPPVAREPVDEVEERSQTVSSGVTFPTLEVQSVLWHPDPTRRQATIVLDGQLATDAREGDLIGGVFVARIEPGSVEFRMGEERKRVNMSP